MSSSSRAGHTAEAHFRLSSFQKGLKRKFPIESGLLKKSDRTLPRFQDANVKLRKTQKLSCCMESLRLLEVYCQELMKTQAKISQGEDVIKFLEAHGQDLEPSFPENSIIVLPSEMGERKTEAPRAPKLTITQPVLSQMYQCVAPFRTKDTQNQPFETTKAEKLEVLMKDRTGTLYYVTRAYIAKEPDELSLEAGIVVEVLEKSENGWWLVWYNGTTGIVPSMFLQPYRNPHSKFLALASPSLCNSLPNLTEAPCLSSKNCAAQQKGNQVYLNQKTQSKDTGSLEGKGIRFPSRSSISGNSSPASGKESWSSSSGNASDQGFCGPCDPENHVVLPETLFQTFGNPGSPSLSQQQNNSGFEEESSRDPVHLLPSSGVGPLPSGPLVPPRPSPHEILQKCSSITRRALQRSLEQPSSPAGSQL
ncbi:hypothetical protein Chor_015012 [Crotalus horridus]